MSGPTYQTGEDVRRGDHIRYHGETGQVDFVVTAKTGDASHDWYLEQFPGGGVMIVAEGCGSVFLGMDDFDDFLEFVARGTDVA